MKHSIEIDQLSFAHPGKDALFQDFSLRLAPGNIYGLLGRNGAGKTTLLQILAGQLHGNSGECRILDHEASRRQPSFLADVYFVAEEMHAPPLTIQGYLKLHAPFYPRFDRDQFAYILGKFELEASAKLAELSYGQRKKVFIAFGLATGARCLIFDEPTNGLDIPARGQFRRLLLEAYDSERVIIVSTHQARDIQKLIDPVIVIDRGRVIFHEYLETVASRIALSLESDEPDDCLFYERTIGGYAVLRPAAGRGSINETEIDIELLFNAILNDPNRFRALFAKESAHA